MSCIPNPPPLPSTFNNQTLNPDQNDCSSTRIDDLSNIRKNLWSYLTRGEDVKVLSLYNPVDSVIQNGPTCGLVTVAMCGQLIKSNISINSSYLLDKAKLMGYSKQGEMFSVANMAKLVEEVLPAQTEVKRNLKDELANIIRHLNKGWPILVPYDADGNHEPCLKKGQSSHWAILLGYCLIIKASEYCQETLRESYLKDEINDDLIHLKMTMDLPNIISRFIEHKTYERLYVYGKQGKSSHLKVWDFHLLSQSNSNLVEVNPKYDQSLLQLPTYGVKEGLCDQFLYVTPNGLN